MVLPIIWLVGAGIAAATGIAAGARGAVKMKEAKDDIDLARRCHESNLKRLEETNKSSSEVMDKLGTNEMEILASFKEFSDLFARIKNPPQFSDINIGGHKIPKFDRQEIIDVSVGATVLVSGLGASALGTAGGFAASGAAYAAVCAFGYASTGSAISGLSGVAASNAALAAIGGGTLAAGGGGVALGSMVLSTATLGVGLLVGGIIFNFAGSKLSEQADEAWRQMRQAEQKIDKICDYLNELKDTAEKYNATLKRVRRIYENNMSELEDVLDSYNPSKNGKVDWHDLDEDEKLLVKNTVSLVQVLFAMCKVKLVLKNETDAESEALNTINHTEIAEAQTMGEQIVAKMAM